MRKRYTSIDYYSTKAYPSVLLLFYRMNTVIVKRNEGQQTATSDMLSTVICLSWLYDSILWVPLQRFSVCEYNRTLCFYAQTLCVCVCKGLAYLHTYFTFYAFYLHYVDGRFLWYFVDNFQHLKCYLTTETTKVKRANERMIE